MRKKCYSCKEKLEENNFKDISRPNHIHYKCNKCRLKMSLKPKKNKCNICGCRANFNFSCHKFGVKCSKHKDPNMIDVKNKKCQEIGCNKRPVYNKEGESVGIFCKSHKEPYMIDVKSSKCQEIGCNKRPIFNKEGELSGIFCSEHKKLNMVNVRHKRCQKKGCSKIPSYNKNGESIGIFCADHKESNMVDIKNRKCQEMGCNKRPVYNNNGKSIGIFCFKHKDVDMIDVITKKCKEKNCIKNAYYAYTNVIPEYCYKHRKSGMIKNPRKKCIGDDDGDCKEIAIYGLENGNPVHCEDHKLEKEYNLSERECPKCKRIDILNSCGICVNFCSMEERDRYMKKQIKKKEEKIEKILEKSVDLPFIHRDDIVDKSCSNRRPDFVYHCGTHVVIVEVDENQHKSYKCTAYGDDKEGSMKGENIRMFEIAQSFDGLPVVFLRYNPDNYKVNGVLEKYAVDKKEKLLVKWVKKCLNEKMEGFKVKYLFYDEFLTSDDSFKDIKEKDVL